MSTHHPYLEYANKVCFSHEHSNLMQNRLQSLLGLIWAPDTSILGGILGSHLQQNRSPCRYHAWWSCFKLGTALGMQPWGTLVSRALCSWLNSVTNDWSRQAPVTLDDKLSLFLKKEKFKGPACHGQVTLFTTQSALCILKFSNHRWKNIFKKIQKAPKNKTWIWCFWTVVLEKNLESPLDCKEIKPVNPKGNQSWIFTGRTNVEAEAPMLWPPDAKDQLTGKDPDAGKDWGQEEKGRTKDETVGWHHQFNRHEFEQTLGDDEGQGSLVCCSPWGLRELDMT